MRRTTTLTALLLGATFIAPTGSASAAGETCRGEAATIVGTGPTLVGTDGRDVIVAGPSVTIAAGAGDDLICVDSPVGSEQIFSNVFDLDAGAGNDVVDSTAMGSNFYLMASLGDGSDTFIGGVASERVAAGAAGTIWVDVPSESERDVIDTGDGSDSVVSGGSGLANDDDVRTGNGEDTVMWSGVMGAQGFLDAGADSDLLIARGAGQTFGVDLTAQKLGRNGVVEASFASIERLRVDSEPDLGMVDIRGTDGDDDVIVNATASLRADLGAGDDHLSLTRTKGFSRIDLGAGTDQVTVRSWDGSVDLDLAAGTLAVDGSSTAAVVGVENAYVSAMRSSVVGNGGANALSVVGCHTTVDGRAGTDDIDRGNYDIDADRGYTCTSSTTTLRGGSGNDTIDGGTGADRIHGDRGNDLIETGRATQGSNEAWGGRGNDKIEGAGDKDVLVGGAGKDKIEGGGAQDLLVGGSGNVKIRGQEGRDTAVGGRDRDRCAAEIRKSCER